MSELLQLCDNFGSSGNCESGTGVFKTWRGIESPGTESLPCEGSGLRRFCLAMRKAALGWAIQCLFAGEINRSMAGIYPPGAAFRLPVPQTKQLGAGAADAAACKSRALCSSSRRTSWRRSGPAHRGQNTSTPLENPAPKRAHASNTCFALSFLVFQQVHTYSTRKDPGQLRDTTLGDSH